MRTGEQSLPVPADSNGFRLVRELSGRRWRIEWTRRWPPSAAQTVRAGFPHTAFTKTQVSGMPKKELTQRDEQARLVHLVDQ